MATLEKLAAKAVVVDPKTIRALILRLNEEERKLKGRDEWHLPGGARDDDSEELSETARREVREETGIHNTQVVGELETAEWDAYYNGSPAHFTAHIFELEVIGAVPEVVLSNESSDSAWAGLNDLDNYPALMPEAKRAIGTVLQRRQNA